jgi:cytochrome c peroxidase
MNQLGANKCLTDRIKIEFSPVSGQILFSLVLISAVSGCSEASSNQDSVTNAETLSPLTQLGEKIFHDASLSANGRQSCASCRDEQHCFALPTADAVSLGNAPSPTPNEIDDVVAFLQTLTNGFQP